MTDHSNPAQQTKGFRKAILNLLTKQVTVTETRAMGEKFKLFTLEGPAFQGTRWAAGQKLQIMLDSAFIARTFTPIEWDTLAGRTRILVYCHGNSSVGDTIRNLKVGDTINVLGPRPSLDINTTTAPLALLGDETSIGLAYAIQHQDPTRELHHFLEVSDYENTRTLLTQLKIERVELFEKQPTEKHLQQLEHRLTSLHCDTIFLLTGKASSIQKLRRTLKSLGTPNSRMLTKAYWAPGKRGLD
jgi:NADPH-dependent ferric siderophore reductase